MRTKPLVALVLAAAAYRAPAAGLAQGSGDLAVVGGTVHVGDGSVLPGATILVRGGRIVEVGAGVRVPEGVPVIDASGSHVAPGFIAADTVLGLVEIDAIRSTRDDTEVGRLNPQVRASAAVNPDSELLPVAMANGVLEAVIVPHGGVICGTSAVMELKGWTREDMTIRGPAALQVDWPDMTIDRSVDVKPPVADQEKKRDDALAELDDFLDQGRTYLAAIPARKAGRVPRADRDMRLEALAPALSGEIPVVVRAESVPRMRAAIAWAARQHVRLVLAGGRDAWRIAAEIAHAGVPVIVEPVRAMPARDDEPYDVAYANPVRLHDAGVAICFSVGNDAFGAATVRNLPDEAAMTLAYGMPAEAALEALTLAPARIFGVDAEVGSIAAGRRANLVVWDGPPLEITSHATHVVLRGVELAHDDRHTRLYEKYRARPAH